MSDLALAISECYKRGGKVLICGNGGLAAESEHFCAELMGKYGRDIFIPCISLTGPSSLVTALANDIGFENVFSHQVEVLARPHDLVIGMTTSNSANVLLAVGEAQLIAAVNTYLIDRRTIPGGTVGEVQNNIIKFLHEVALEAKELCVADPVRQS